MHEDLGSNPQLWTRLLIQCCGGQRQEDGFNFLSPGLGEKRPLKGIRQKMLNTPGVPLWPFMPTKEPLGHTFAYTETDSQGNTHTHTCTHITGTLESLSCLVGKSTTITTACRYRQTTLYR